MFDVSRLTIYYKELKEIERRQIMSKRKEFLDYVEKKLRYLYGDKIVQIIEVTKNNDTRYTGIALRGSVSAIHPVVNIEKYLEMVDNGEEAYEALYEAIKKDIEEVLNSVSVGKFDSDVRPFVDSINDFAGIRDHLRVRLVNLPYNKGYISSNGIPFRTFLRDLALIPYILVEKGASASVNGQIIERWGVSSTTVLDCAIGNTIKEPYICRKLVDLLPENMRFSTDFDTGMYVLSNKTGYFGASALIIPTQSELIETVGTDKIIALPSSIHEWILCNGDMIHDGDLDELVKSVNSTELEKHEILSDHAYCLWNYSLTESFIF